MKQCKLEDKTTKDISQIREFGFVAWEFLFAIYKVSWDKLAANKYNKLFRQCVSAQCNKLLLKSLETTIPSFMKKEKKENVSRILPPIPSRPSQSIKIWLQISNWIKLHMSKY